MSSQRGNVQKSKPPKHANKTKFRNDLHDTSQRTKAINCLKITSCCPKCKDVIEWKIKYKKYKPLTQPKKWYVVVCWNKTLCCNKTFILKLENFVTDLSGERQSELTGGRKTRQEAGPAASLNRGPTFAGRTPNRPKVRSGYGPPVKFNFNQGNV